MENDDSKPSGEIDPARRGILKRLGLAAAAGYSAPVMLQLAQARASGSGGSGGGGYGGGGGGSGGGSIVPRRVQRRQVRRPRQRPEIVVTTPDAAAIDLIASQGYGLLSRDRLELIGAEIARFAVPASLTIEQAREQIGQLVPGALFDANHLYRPGELPCGDNTCAAFEMIGWHFAAHRCSSPTALGMIDTSVNTDHAALQGVDIEAFSTIAEGRKPASALHGTAIAILLAGRKDTRTPGLLDGVRLVAAEAFHRDASGQDGADAYDVARAISMLAERDLGVINLSFTGPENQILRRVVAAALDKGVLLVAAAGNAGPRSNPLYPAAFDGVVAVTAIDSRQRVYRQANAGDYIDFAAPGVRIWTAASISGGRFRSGTSYAAPFVAAALAVARSQWPEDEPDSILARLSEGAVDLGEPGRDTIFGWGLVQAPACFGAPDAVVRPAGASEEAELPVE